VICGCAIHSFRTFVDILFTHIAASNRPQVLLLQHAVPRRVLVPVVQHVSQHRAAALSTQLYVQCASCCTACIFISSARSLTSCFDRSWFRRSLPFPNVSLGFVCPRHQLVRAVRESHRRSVGVRARSGALLQWDCSCMNCVPQLHGSWFVCSRHCWPLCRAPLWPHALTSGSWARGARAPPTAAFR